MSRSPNELVNTITAERIIELWGNGTNTNKSEIARLVGCHRQTVRNVLIEAGVIEPSSEHTTEAHRQLQAMRDECQPLLKQIYPPSLPANQYIELPAKIVYFDDLHLPFTRFDLIEEMLKQDGDADYFVWGEVLNLDAFAWYVKNYISNPTQEDEIAGRLVELLLTHFKGGFTLETNHTRRIDKLLASITDPIQLDFLRRSFDGLLPSFTRLSRKVRYMGSSILQLGQALFAHYDEFLATLGKTPTEIARGIDNYDDALGVRPPWTVLNIGHTHNLVYEWGGKRLFQEVGCMCWLQDYMFRGKLPLAMRRFRWINGYGVVVLNKDGSVDFRNTGTRFLGLATKPQFTAPEKGAAAP